MYASTAGNLIQHELSAPLPPLPSLPPSFVQNSSFFDIFKLTDKDERNSGLAFYLHTFHEKAPQNEALTRMTLYLLKEHFHEKARFQERLGYDHHVDIYEGPNSSGLIISLQGEKDPGDAERSIEKILEEFHVKI